MAGTNSQNHRPRSPTLSVDTSPAFPRKVLFAKRENTKGPIETTEAAYPLGNYSRPERNRLLDSFAAHEPPNRPTTPPRFPSAKQPGSGSSKRRRPRPPPLKFTDAARPDRPELRITLHDIRSSRWIEDLDHHASEQVYLTIDAASLSKMSTIDTDFCWVHHQRDTDDMHFKDFVHIVNNTPLYNHEHEVALKVLDEVESMRHVYAQGKYFKPLVHQVTNTTETIAGKKTEVTATFISMPMFCAMQSKDSSSGHSHSSRENAFQKLFQTIYAAMYEFVHGEQYDEDHHKDLATKELHKRDGHPVRSLMQYKNILAVDSSRDWRQAMIRLGDRKGHRQPFLHVPECWILIINQYTIVTCCPFSVEEIQGDNIKQQPPEKEDKRVDVKYINLSGATREFRCRTWVGLLTIIADIEHQLDSEVELGVQLSLDASPYKLVDPKFRLIDRKRWLRLTSSGQDNTRISVRLVKTIEGSPLNISCSTREAEASELLAWEVMRYQVMVEDLRKRLKRCRLQRDAALQVSAIELEITQTLAKLAFASRRRLRRRILYAAVRYHLIDPSGYLFESSTTYRDEVRDRVMSAKTQTSVATGRSESTAAPGGSGRLQSLPSGSRAGSRAVSPTASSSARAKQTMPSSKPPLSVVRDLQNTSEVSLPMAYDVHIEKQIIERFKPPPKRKLRDLREDTMPLITRSMTGVPSIQINGNSSDHFPTPRKSSTAIGVLMSPVEDRPPRVSNRARTFVNSNGLIDRPKTVNRPASPGEIAPIARAPTFLISERESGPLTGSPDPGRRESRQAETPILPTLHPFRQRPQNIVPSNRPTPIAPQRLPPLSGSKKFVIGHAVDERKHEVDPASSMDQPPALQSNGTPSRSSDIRGDSALSLTTEKVRVRVTTARLQKDLRKLQPFFKWRSVGRIGPMTPQLTRNPQAFETMFDASGGISEEPATAGSNEILDYPAKDTLGILHDQMTSRNYFVSEDFHVQPSDFLEAQEMSFDDVADLLDAQVPIHRQSTHREADEFRWNAMVEVVLHVDSILRCFLGDDDQNDPLIRKVWGIVGAIANISRSDIQLIDIACKDFGSDILTWLRDQTQEIEQACRDTLSSARSDTGRQVEQLDFPLPHVFLSQFRDFILLLLSVSLLPLRPDHYAPAVRALAGVVAAGWSECDTALARTAKEFEEHGDKDDYMHESINNADTLLGLLLQNAFALSCSPMDNAKLDRPHCDLEHIYRRWTAVCHERAIREASAEMYEEVRLLREELDVVVTVLKNQKDVWEDICRVRQSPKQTLDIRLNKRMETFLDDMINHFETLEAYAKEAEELTTNSIRVSNEDNSKAILIFTFVTVIFLPLNSISSILGMNTVDIRNMVRTSRLFWEISIPVMLFVLVACIILVKLRFKFGLRRKMGRWVLKLFPDSFETHHMRIKRQGRDMPRQR